MTARVHPTPIELTMPLTRAYEEHEVGPDIARIYADIRSSFDLPFVPTIFKTAAGNPDYLKTMWRDLGPVAASREFQNAATAMDEFVRSKAIEGGWHFSDQERVLAEQKISTFDMPVLAGVVGVFARALPRMLLFVRLMQLGYSGGQKGRFTSGKQSPALSRLISLHIPSEREAGLRVWLIYAEIRRHTRSKQVMSLYRALSPFPGYLASAWLDTKKLFADREFQRARDQVAHRAAALTVGMPVRDHRALGRNIEAKQWRDIEEFVDDAARMLPHYTLLAPVWQRSFAAANQRRAA